MIPHFLPILQLHHPSAVVVGDREEVRTLCGLEPGPGTHRCFCLALQEHARTTAFILGAAEPLPVLGLSTSLPSSGSSSGVSPDISLASINSDHTCSLYSTAADSESLLSIPAESFPNRRSEANIDIKHRKFQLGRAAAVNRRL